MTSMPTINDRMVVELRRTGKRQATFSRARSSTPSIGPRVVPQEVDCSVAGPGTICWGPGPCDPTTGRAPVLRCDGSNGCTRRDSVAC